MKSQINEKNELLSVFFLKSGKPQNYCVKVPQNAAKGIDISKNSRGSMPPDPLSPLDSTDGHFLVENFRPPLFQNPVSTPAIVIVRSVKIYHYDINHT